MAGAGGVASSRLSEERRNWRKDHPFGFVAKPATNEDGSTNLMRWNCLLPGKAGTDWEGGLYPLTLDFTADYPSTPPRVHFPRGFYHPNVFNEGDVCLSILNPNKAWAPSITIRQILVGVQELLADPNVNDPANNCFHIYKNNRAEYDAAVRVQARRYSADKNG